MSKRAKMLRKYYEFHESKQELAGEPPGPKCSHNCDDCREAQRCAVEDDLRLEAMYEDNE